MEDLCKSASEPHGITNVLLPMKKQPHYMTKGLLQKAREPQHVTNDTLQRERDSQEMTRNSLQKAGDPQQIEKGSQYMKKGSISRMAKEPQDSMKDPRRVAKEPQKREKEPRHLKNNPSSLMRGPQEKREDLVKMAEEPQCTTRIKRHMATQPQQMATEPPHIKKDSLQMRKNSEQMGQELRYMRHDPLQMEEKPQNVRGDSRQMASGPQYISKGRPREVEIELQQIQKACEPIKRDTHQIKMMPRSINKDVLQALNKPHHVAGKLQYMKKDSLKVVSKPQQVVKNPQCKKQEPEQMAKGAQDTKNDEMKMTEESQQMTRDRRQLCVCMVSDFFYPSLGGIETHIYTLSQCLMQRGYKVFVVTHFAPPGRHGVRYMLNGLKVYYLPFRSFVLNATFPTGFSLFPIMRNILLRERVDIVHGHQATSTLAHETIFIARNLGLQVVYTDHSLFGFADLASIHLNKIFHFCLHDMNACICVSHTHRENLVLRAGLPPSRVHVINNAIDPESLYPDVSRRPPPPHIRIVVLSRLTYRKGIDLLVRVIPLICKKHSHVQFVIGGDGPKRIILEEMREQHRLFDRVQLVEAAACGLLVVSTNVGGIPEVLPPHMVLLAEPETLAVAKQVDEAVAVVHRVDPFSFHRQVQRMYSWQDVAARTERIYFSLLLPDLPYPPCYCTRRGRTHRRGEKFQACAPGCPCAQQQKKPLPVRRSCTTSVEPCRMPRRQNVSSSNRGSTAGHGSTPRKYVGQWRRSRSIDSILSHGGDDSGRCTRRSGSGRRCSPGSIIGRGPRRRVSTNHSSRCRMRPVYSVSRSRPCHKSSSKDRCDGADGTSAHCSANVGDASSDSDGQRSSSYDSDEEDRCYCVCCNLPPLCCGCVQLPPSPPPLPSATAMVQRLRTAYKLGPVSGKIFCIVIILGWIYTRILDYFLPR